MPKYAHKQISPACMQQLVCAQLCFPFFYLYIYFYVQFTVSPFLFKIKMSLFVICCLLYQLSVILVQSGRLVNYQNSIHHATDRSQAVHTTFQVFKGSCVCFVCLYLWLHVLSFYGALFAFLSNNVLNVLGFEILRYVLASFLYLHLLAYALRFCLVCVEYKIFTLYW